MPTDKKYDLEPRTTRFAKDVRNFVSRIPRSISNIEDGKQLTRSSGSIAANYIEANESVSKSDFCYRVKICRKEAKETILWLSLINPGEQSNLGEEQKRLSQEAQELVLIFASILRKVGAIQ